MGSSLQSAGDAYGQPMEISRLHHEVSPHFEILTSCSVFQDFTFHMTDGPQVDLRQGNTLPSVQTCRGHMTPAAFLMQVSSFSSIIGYAVMWRL